MAELPCHPDLFDLLVCPEARTSLKWTGGRLVSTDPATRRAYRVEDGIPIMLLEESTVLTPAEWQQAMADAGPVGAGAEAVRARAAG